MFFPRGLSPTDYHIFKPTNNGVCFQTAAIRTFGNDRIFSAKKEMPLQSVDKGLGSRSVLFHFFLLRIPYTVGHRSILASLILDFITAILSQRECRNFYHCQSLIYILYLAK